MNSRIRKAEKIRAVLNDAGMAASGCSRILDIGCSSGLVLEQLINEATVCVGLDIDETVNRCGRPTLFVIGDGESLPFPAQVFDVVICNHVYEHTDSPARLVAEIQRVLRDDGLCYFAGPNRLDVIEPHYGLPFLSWLPHALADAYVRLCGKGDAYMAKPYTWWGLRRLLRGFEVRDYTLVVMEDPLRFHISDLLPPGSWKHRLALLLMRLVPCMVPDFILVLRRKQG